MRGTTAGLVRDCATASGQSPAHRFEVLGFREQQRLTRPWHGNGNALLQGQAAGSDPRNENIDRRPRGSGPVVECCSIGALLRIHHKHSAGLEYTSDLTDCPVEVQSMVEGVAVHNVHAAVGKDKFVEVSGQHNGVVLTRVEVNTDCKGTHVVKRANLAAYPRR